MVRLLVFLLTIALIAMGLAWLADRPGTLQIVWQGYDVETTVFRAVVLLAAAVASLFFLCFAPSGTARQQSAIVW